MHRVLSVVALALTTVALITPAGAVPPQAMEPPGGAGDVADGADLADVADVEIRPNWKPGMTFKLERVREKRETNRAGVTKGHITTTPVTARVTSVDLAGAKLGLDWTLGTAKVDTGGARNPFLDTSANLFEGATAKVMLDDLADPRRILNAGALQTHAQQGIDELEVKYAASGWMRNAVKQLRNSVARPEQLNGKLLAELRLFFMCSGGDYPPGKALSYTQEVNQPFGNQFGRAKVSMTLSFTLAKPAPGAKQYTVTFSNRLDAAAARAPLFTAYQAFARQRGLRMPTSAAELGDIEFTDDATFVLDAKTGWPHSVKHVRSVKVGGTSRVESNRFRLLRVTR